jgi:hypothetical protein
MNYCVLPVLQTGRATTELFVLLYGPFIWSLPSITTVKQDSQEPVSEVETPGVSRHILVGQDRLLRLWPGLGDPKTGRGTREMIRRSNALELYRCTENRS